LGGLTREVEMENLIGGEIAGGNFQGKKQKK
jgi:hypothetical protein